MTRVALLLSTVAYIGYAPVAPGTVGSLPGLAIALALHAGGHWRLELALIVILFFAGAWAATRAERHFGHIDPGPIVIDEVVGMMITMAFIPLGWLGALVAFVTFRACDVIKPFPASRLERLPGGWGVMSDDVMAGLWAYAIVRLLVWCCPQWML
jgi:phosphatidylglycerophosphatase A